LLAAGLPTRVIRDVLPYLRSADVTHLGAAPGPVLQALCREAASLQTRIDELAAPAPGSHRVRRDSDTDDIGLTLTPM